MWKIAAIAICFLAATAQADMLYTWIDTDGVVVISDRPGPEGCEKIAYRPTTKAQIRKTKQRQKAILNSVAPKAVPKPATPKKIVPRKKTTITMPSGDVYFQTSNPNVYHGVDGIIRVK